MPKAALPLPILTDDQKHLIEDNYQMELRALTCKVFNDETLTRRHIECKAVMAHLASLGKVAVNSAVVTRIEGITLTNEQMEHIRNNCGNSLPLEMARVLWHDHTISIDDARVRLVTAYARKFNPSLESNEVVGEYEPPQTIGGLIDKANRYAVNPKKDGKPQFDRNNLSNQDKKNLTGLLDNMNLPIFRVEANKFTKKLDRELYESTFILHCWDKPDLEAADIQKYITLASQTVKYQQIDTIAQKLDQKLNEALDDPAGKFSMSDAEVLNSYREKANQSLKNISDLMKSLVGDRSKKMAERRDANASMHNLVSSWKMEDLRRRIIKIAELKQRAALKQEVERLSDMDSLRVEIFGLNSDDILL